ncbi:hypothetical protein BBF96_11305 [Anoxybacter fermentans]|uniref:O-antigen polysaccharide polymerase Wzy n=2 Tax=Anoxybacter fermentans TaxID=1323375 RepID=A0A3S9T001_9FIRM|nr:hypothetical protein BBF96_11305 [Anoxybacter fermentans]
MVSINNITEVQKHTNNRKSRYMFSLSIRAFVKYIVILIFTSIFLLNTANGFSQNSSQIIAWSVLVLSVYLVIHVRKNINLFVLYSILAYFNYSIIMPNYINKLSSSYFTSFSNDPVSHIGVNILFLFLLSLIIFMPTHIKPLFIKENMFINKNPHNVHLLTLGIGLILLYILIFQFDRPDVLGVRGRPSPLYEYSLIFFIVGFYFTAKNKYSKMILSIILVLFALQNFFFGGRIIGLQLILLYFIMFYAYKTKISRLIPFVLVGFIMMSLIGQERTMLNLSIDAIKGVINNIQTRMFALDTSYSAYFTSLTFLKVEEMLSINQRLDLFKQFFLSIFFGGRIQNSSLPIYTLKFYHHYNGGVLPYHFQFYLGWAGVVVSALIITIYTKIINSLNFDTVGFKKCLSVYVISSVFRWYLYSPIIILRGVIFLAIVYYIASMINGLKIKSMVN